VAPLRPREFWRHGDHSDARCVVGVEGMMLYFYQPRPAGTCPRLAESVETTTMSSPSVDQVAFLTPCPHLDAEAGRCRASADAGCVFSHEREA